MVGDDIMDFKIEDILNNTVDGVSKETLSSVISEVITDADKNSSKEISEILTGN